MEHPLRVYRTARKITLAQIADATGVTKGAISKIENWRSSPSIGLIQKITAATKGKIKANDFVPPAPSHAEASQ